MNAAENSSQGVIYTFCSSRVKVMSVANPSLINSIYLNHKITITGFRTVHFKEVLVHVKEVTYTTKKDYDVY